MTIKILSLVSLLGSQNSNVNINYLHLFGCTFANFERYYIIKNKDNHYLFSLFSFNAVLKWLVSLRGQVKPKKRSTDLVYTFLTWIFG